ncbi:MAG TPA: response regulator [Methanospirillum sp.]|uniref:response regulator n=1 Tax=Methanospirillum sp. TaxID=45200 RepID=UPI002CEC0620|nr:response regulator [Methanospirillum sp.]HOJ97491.1 response regulator [Methanospirillum sp.]
MGKNPKKILIIDDEAVFREAIARALTSCGYHCFPEEDPATGIMRLKRESFDLLILDIMMDPFDGWDTLSHLRTFSNGRETPVIMASAKKLNIEEVIRYGEYVAGFLEKPFVDSEFCEAIHQFFDWYDPLISNANAARLQGVPQEICTAWIRTNRQIRAINQMLENVYVSGLPDEFLSEEERMEHRMAQVREILEEKRKERDNIRIQYPVFSI